jgi:hypothetical protein
VTVAKNITLTDEEALLLVALVEAAAQLLPMASDEFTNVAKLYHTLSQQTGITIGE